MNPERLTAVRIRGGVAFDYFMHHSNYQAIYGYVKARFDSGRGLFKNFMEVKNK